ncbi:extracellular solute-binding protein [Clostridium paraputrificum]|uniref:extracellular solute-binding protein n=1 Tax=Clostridium TaxID=1485 RepID=UPI003D34864F
MKKGIYGVIIISLLALFVTTVFISNSDNTVTIYTAHYEDQIEEYLTDFNKKYPDIKVNIVRDGSGVVAAKLLMEKDNPRADIVWGLPGSNALILDRFNAFAPYDSPMRSNIEPRFYDQVNSVPTWVGTSAWMTVLTVNTKELEARGLPMPKSYQDLLNPIYKGQIVMPNPSSSGTGYLVVNTLVQLYGEEKAWEYMDNIDKNIKEYSHSGSGPTRMVERGEALIGIGMDFTSFKSEKDNSYIKTIIPEEGCGWDVEIVALANKPKVKEAAKIFYDWAISEEALRMHGKNRSLISIKDFKYDLNPDAPAGMDEKMIDNDLNWASENQNRLTKEWEKRYGVE